VSSTSGIDFTACSEGLNPLHLRFDEPASEFCLDKGHRTKVKVSVRNYSPQVPQAENMPQYSAAWDDRRRTSSKEDCRAKPGQFPTFSFSCRRVHGFFGAGMGAKGCGQHRRHGEGPDRRHRGESQSDGK
jgi:hypothetical protein